MKNDKKIQNPTDHKIAVAITLVLGALLCWWIWSAALNTGKKVKLEAHTGDYNVVNPSTIMINYSVKNTTDRAGRSDCSIRVNDPSHTYTGSDFGFKSANEIQPGATYNGVAQLTITNNGAKYITEGHISCTLE